MNKRNPKASRRFCESSGAVAIDSECAFRLRFSHIDGRVCRGIDYGPGQHGSHSSVDRIFVLEVEFGAANRSNRYRSLFPDINQGPRQLAGFAGDQNRAHSTFFL
jgi:hypothetical protein